MVMTLLESEYNDLIDDIYNRIEPMKYGWPPSPVGFISILPKANGFAAQQGKTCQRY